MAKRPTVKKPRLNVHQMLVLRMEAQEIPWAQGRWVNKAQENLMGRGVIGRWGGMTGLGQLVLRAFHDKRGDNRNVNK